MIMKKPLINNIELIEALINKTEFTCDNFTGASVIQTITNNRTIIKYKVSLYFGYVDKKPITRIIEIDRDVFLVLPSAIDEYIKQLENPSNNNVLSISNLIGNITPNVTSNVPLTNTNILTTNTLFDKFWEQYPNKVNKKKASISFNNLTKTQQHSAVNDIETRFKDTDKKYIPHPTTYINGERWEDEKPTNTTKKIWMNGI